MSSFLVQENNVSLFGKADFSSLSEETLQYSWTSPSIGKNQSNFDAFVIIDFTKGIFTFLKTQYMVETEDDPDIINRIYNHKIEEIIRFLSKFSIEIPQYCVVSQDITLNFYSVGFNGNHESRYHTDLLPITNLLSTETDLEVSEYQQNIKKSTLDIEMNINTNMKDVYNNKSQEIVYIKKVNGKGWAR